LSPEEIEGIERGISPCKAGNGIDGETVFARLDVIIASRRDAA